MMFESSSDFYDALYSFKDYNKEASDIRGYIYKQNPNVKTILDIACGTGKHIEYLSSFFQVDGIDLNEKFVRIASERNSASHFWCEDMTNFNLNKKYDVVMCLFSSIAYVKTLESVLKTVEQFRNHLMENGFIIIEPWFTPQAWESGFVSILNTETEEFKISRMSHADRDGNLSILNFEYLVGFKNGIQHLSERHELGLFNTEELIQTLELTGMKVEYDPIGISGRGLYMLS
jgi:SAM-dependent methyltransferase